MSTVHHCFMQLWVPFEIAVIACKIGRRTSSHVDSRSTWAALHLCLPQRIKQELLWETILAPRVMLVEQHVMLHHLFKAAQQPKSPMEAGLLGVLHVPEVQHLTVKPSGPDWFCLAGPVGCAMCFGGLMMSAVCIAAPCRAWWIKAVWDACTQSSVSLC